MLFTADTYYRNETAEDARCEKCATCYYLPNLESGAMVDKNICTFCFLGDRYVPNNVNPKEYFKDYGDDWF